MKLNRETWARLAPSKIHGVGVFALGDIKKGQKLYLDQMPALYNLRYADFNKLRPEVKQIILERWPQITQGSKFVSPTERFQAYLNHAPTVDEINYDAFLDVAIKDIPAGTEILEDYTRIPNYDKVFPWLANKNEKGAGK